MWPQQGNWQHLASQGQGGSVPSSSINQPQSAVQQQGTATGDANTSDWAAKAAQWAQQKQLSDQLLLQQQQRHQQQLYQQHYPQVYHQQQPPQAQYVQPQHFQQQPQPAQVYQPQGYHQPHPTQPQGYPQYYQQHQQQQPVAPAPTTTQQMRPHYYQQQHQQQPLYQQTPQQSFIQQPPTQQIQMPASVHHPSSFATHQPQQEPPQSQHYRGNQELHPPPQPVLPAAGSVAEQQSQALPPVHPNTEQHQSSSESVTTRQFKPHPYHLNSEDKQNVSVSDTNARKYPVEEEPNVNPSNENLYGSQSKESTEQHSEQQPPYTVEDPTQAHYHEAYSLHDGRLSNSSSKAIPGLDLVPEEKSRHTVEQGPPAAAAARGVMETRGLLEGNLQSAHPRNELARPSPVESGKESSAKGQNSNQMIQSLGKIVSQLQALQERSSNNSKPRDSSANQILNSSWKKEDEPDEGEDGTHPLTTDQAGDETTRKVAALIENESDSEGEGTSSKPVHYQQATSDSREFSGFNTIRNVYQEEAYHSEVSKEGFPYQGYPDHELYSSGPPPPPSSKIPQYYSHEDLPLKETHHPHIHQYQEYPTSDNSTQPPVNHNEYRPSKYGLDPSPPTDSPTRSSAYHDQDNPRLLPRVPHQAPYLHPQHHQMGYEYEGTSRPPPPAAPREEQPLFYEREEYQYDRKPMYTDYDERMPTRNLYNPPPESIPSVDYQHGSTSRLISSMQSVDYDHGRGQDPYDTGKDDSIHSGIDTASYFPSYGSALSELQQHKSLPNWLRKELEELEMKKQREAQRVAAQRSGIMLGEKMTHGSWKDEIEAEEEEEEEGNMVEGQGRLMRAPRSPNYRKRSQLESPTRREQSEERETSHEGSVEIHEEPDEEDRQIRVITKVRQMLTEVLLDVTNSEMENVSMEVLGITKVDISSLQEEQPPGKNVLGLNVYGSPSDSDDAKEKERSPPLDPSIVAAAFRGNFSDDKPTHKLHPKWDVQEFKPRSIEKPENGERKCDSSLKKRHTDSPKRSNSSKSHSTTHSLEKKDSTKRKNSSEDKHSSSKHSSGRSRKRSRSRERKSEKETSVCVEGTVETSGGYSRIVSILDSETFPTPSEEHDHKLKQNDDKESKDRRYGTDEEKKRRDHRRKNEERSHTRDKSSSSSSRRDQKDYHSRSSKSKSGRKHSNRSPSPPPRDSKHSYQSRSRSPRHHKSSRERK